MRLKPLLVMVPESFKRDGRTRYACDNCPNRREGQKCYANVFMCPLAQGKPAVEQKDGDICDGDCTIYAVKP